MEPAHIPSLSHVTKLKNYPIIYNMLSMTNFVVIHMYFMLLDVVSIFDVFKKLELEFATFYFGNIYRECYIEIIFIHV